VIELSDIAAAAVETAGVSVRYVRVESWLGGTLVADDIPVVSATEDQDISLRVPERLTFTVPMLDGTTSWVPSAYDSALGAFGQRVRVSLGIEITAGQVEWINRGWFLINTSETDNDSVQVEALGLLSLVDEADLPNEYQPAAGATLASICRDLVEPGITINDDAAPADRTAASSITWSDNRLDSLSAVLDAWPAEASISADGYLVITSPPGDPDTADVVLELTDGTGGTVIDYGGTVTREGAFNAVVAKGQYPDTDATRAGQEIIQTAYDTDPASPYVQGGTFSPYIVPYGYSSPLMTTPAQVLAAARTRLRSLRRAAALTLKVSAVPHPGIELGDVVLLTSTRLGISEALGTVDGLRRYRAAIDHRHRSGHRHVGGERG
jgi:hypothetical protein